jgi:DNA-binding GntR family transcriptional regulator
MSAPWKLTPELIATISRLRQYQRWSLRRIAKALGLSHTTVRRALKLLEPAA